VTAAIVTPEAIRRAVSSAVQGASCALVQGDLSPGGTLNLQGVVGGGAPIQDLLRRVRDAAPNAPLNWSVEQANGPYCGVLNLVHAYARPFGSTAGGMAVGLAGGKNHLTDTDKFQIQAEMPGFRGYFELDYFSSDGTVFHARTAAQGSPAVAAHSMQTYDAEVGPPFGTDLIVAIASSAPLFGRGEKLSDQAEPYLRQLRAAIGTAANHRASLAAGAYVVHTNPKS
jgi:serine/threonine-protein kinase